MSVCILSIAFKISHGLQNDQVRGIKDKTAFWSTTQQNVSLSEIKITSFDEKIRGRSALDDIKIISKIMRHLLMTDTLEKNTAAILPTCWDLSKGQKSSSSTTNTAIHATPLSEHNLFRFTDTKTPFVTCQLSAVPPLGHWSWFLEGVHPARLRSPPEAATLSLLAWRRQLSSLQF